MLISLHQHFPVRITDWLVSAILFSWGLALFSVAPAIWALPTYAALNHIASQSAWALTATVIGFARICALFVNGAVQRSPHARMIGAALTTLIWVQLSFALAYGDLVGPGIAIFPWLAFADIFNVYRAAKDARVSDHRAFEKRRTTAERAAAT